MSTTSFLSPISKNATPTALSNSISPSLNSSGDAGYRSRSSPAFEKPLLDGVANYHGKVLSFHGNGIYGRASTFGRHAANFGALLRSDVGAQLQASGYASNDRTPRNDKQLRPKCPRGHTLKYRQCWCICKKCRTEVSMGSISYGGCPCKYVLCRLCARPQIDQGEISPSRSVQNSNVSQSPSTVQNDLSLSQSMLSSTSNDSPLREGNHRTGSSSSLSKKRTEGSSNRSIKLQLFSERVDEIKAKEKKEEMEKAAHRRKSAPANLCRIRAQSEDASEERALSNKSTPRALTERGSVRYNASQRLLARGSFLDSRSRADSWGRLSKAELADVNGSSFRRSKSAEEAALLTALLEAMPPVQQGEAIKQDPALLLGALDDVTPLDRKGIPLNELFQDTQDDVKQLNGTPRLNAGNLSSRIEKLEAASRAPHLRIDQGAYAPSGLSTPVRLSSPSGVRELREPNGRDLDPVLIRYCTMCHMPNPGVGRLRRARCVRCRYLFNPSRARRPTVTLAKF